MTRCGNTELEKPIAIRPTSETVMYPYFAQVGGGGAVCWGGGRRRGGEKGGMEGEEKEGPIRLPSNAICSMHSLFVH